jgi:hypothetical protein
MKLGKFIINEEVIDKLYDIWGINDLTWGDDEDALFYAQCIFPKIKIDQHDIAGIFDDFNHDNPC